MYRTSQYLLLLPLALQPAVGFGLSNNTSPFVPIYHQLSPSSHSQNLKITFHFSPSFPGSSSSSRSFEFFSEYIFGHPIVLHSLEVTQPTYPLSLYPFYYICAFIKLFLPPRGKFCSLVLGLLWVDCGQAVINLHVLRNRLLTMRASTQTHFVISSPRLRPVIYETVYRDYELFKVMTKCLQ